MIKKLMTIFGVLAVIGVSGIGPGVAPARAESHQECVQREQLSENLERVAAELSSLVTDSEFRESLTAQIKASPRKNIVVLRDFLGVALEQDQQEGAERILDLAALVQETEVLTKNCGIPRLEVKLPVKAHLDLLDSSDAVSVMAAPLADESEVESLTAYSNGERLALSADEPPEIPTLVILPAETESLDPTYPLPTSEEPGDEENTDRVVDDFVGIPWIWIDDDHESWLSGDPEIYVRIIRFRFDPFGIVNEKVDLPGVNGEQVWYNLGDPNSTYKFVSTTNFAPVIQLQVWEEDSGAHGGDDHLGTITFFWTGLPFAGYIEFSNGDARIFADRD